MRAGGYWLKFGSPGSPAPMIGAPLILDTVPVRQGWNLIGSCTDPVPTVSIASDSPGMSTSRFFGYNGLYVPSDTINSAVGYWVKVDRDGRLILASHAHTGAAASRIRIVPTSELPPPPPHGYSIRSAGVPREYALEQAYPSPFNPSTTIRYQVPLASTLSLKVYDLLGQTVATLFDGQRAAGSWSAMWNASGCASGVYFYALEAVATSDPGKTFTSVKKLILLK